MNSDLDFDSDIKAAFDRIVARTPDIGPPPQTVETSGDSSHGRIWLAVAAASIVVAGTVAIGLTRSNGSDPVTSIAPVQTAPNEPLEQTSVPASSVVESSIPETTAPLPTDSSRLSFEDLLEWLGPWDLAPQATASAMVGSTGTIDYTIEVSEARFCVTISEAGSGCNMNEDALVWGPQRPLAGFNDNSGGSGRWTRWFVVPAGVELSLWANDVEACDLQSFSLDQFGDAVLWACEHPGTVPRDLELRASRGTESASATLGNLPPDLFPPPTTTTVSPAPTRLAVGGPSMVAAAIAFNGVGFDVVADYSSSFVEVAATLEQLAASGDLPATVVLDVASNGSLSRDSLDRLMQRPLRNADRVVFVTTNIDGDRADPNNELLRSLPHTYANAVLLDWATQASSCPGDCFYDDGVSLRQDGQRYFAELVATASRIPTPYEATGLRVGDIGDPNALPPGMTADGQFDMALVSDWISVGRDGVVIGFVRKVDSHRVPPPPSDPPQQQEPNIIYDDNGEPIGRFGPDGFPVLDTD